MRRVLRAEWRAAGLRSTVLCVQPQVRVPQCPGLRGVVRFGAHPASRGSALPALATVSPIARGCVSTETRRRQTPPTHPPQPPPADQHAALACAGWLVKGAMDCFRAVFQSHETSERAFHLTSKGIDNKPANYTVWYATNVATLVVQTRATSPVGGQSVGGRRVGVAIFVCRSAERCAQRPLWLFWVGVVVVVVVGPSCFLAPCKGWWVCCSVATPRVSMLRRTLQALSAAGGQSSQH